MKHRHAPRAIGYALFFWIAIANAALAQDLSKDGWRLWRDEQAAWKDDQIFLPDQVHLDQLPVNPPTGGWQQLTDRAGIAVTLPSTVEEHFWGATTRPYTPDEYRSADDDHDFANGNYLGVSWWWRNFDAPAAKPGQRILVHFAADDCAARCIATGNCAAIRS